MVGDFLVFSNGHIMRVISVCRHGKAQTNRRVFFHRLAGVAYSGTSTSAATTH
jgi:hypothetical protein